MNNPAYWRLYYQVQGALIKTYGDHKSYMVSSTSITSALLKDEEPTDTLYPPIATMVKV